MAYSIEQIQKILQANWLGQVSPAATVEHLLLDSRQVFFPGSSLFFALKGRRLDGHQFIDSAYHAGVRNFVVSRPIEPGRFPEANFLQVPDVLDALQKLAAHHRRKSQLPEVVGITGSNGKTILKEWLFQLLHPDLRIVRSPKSFNSQIGVPLSVWQINDKHELGLFEAGISTRGEMARLAPLIECSTGMLTHMGDAHNEGFTSMEEKIREKLKLFRHASTIFYRADHPLVNQLIEATYGDRERITWSSEHEANLQVSSIEKDKQGIRITGIYEGEKLSVHIPFSDEASIENAILCWLFLLHRGYSNPLIRRRMEQLEPVEMRLELKAGINFCTLINDSYNSDLHSLTTALQFLDQQNSRSAGRVLFLSDILQSGIPAPKLYRQVARMMREKEIRQFFGIGEEVRHIESFLDQDMEAFFYPDTDAFLRHIDQHTFSHQTILLKGARTFAFERIVNRLSYQAHKTVLEIDLTALLHNLHIYRRMLQEDTQLLVMVKASAYGTGAAEVARLLEFQGVDYLGVAYPDEGVALRKEGIRTPILVLNPEESSFEVLRRYELEPEIYTLPQLQRLLETLPENQQAFPIHLKLETGMYRLGFTEEDLPALIEILAAQQKVVVKSAFSHLAVSEVSEEDLFTHQQAQRFQKMFDALIKGLDYQPMQHLLNSSGIVRFPEYQMDMARLGIGLYGIDNSHSIQTQLEPVLTLKATISQIKGIPAGATVGYGRLGRSDQARRIATISIGYADGLLRAAGNGRYSLQIRGRMAPTVGNICMDMCMVDITHIPDAREGDEVIVFGQAPTAADLAGCYGTIPYEVFTNISERVKRIYLQE